ncbi:porin [Polynucleobacter sp. SHI8]|uniref:porin n=1 Tax=unclassified Polynucleobacter TaxID=2640945 RepID=UPI0024907866|nr:MULTISPECIES: porin [unclassified Polynucleobacter]BDW10047.1 porin [Polynucleobacter sp. SHI2]BDW12493.1 porin [Polynucleobacter sp. SHI8]
MKKSLFALAALGAFAGAAQAQSSVTLFGTLDSSIQYIQNGGVVGSTTAPGKDSDATKAAGLSTGTPATGSNFTYYDSAIASSQWGMKGTEDLGGGMKANFYLAGDANTNNGGTHNDGLFRRGAWVGLQGGFGEVRLGTQANPIVTSSANALPLMGNTAHGFRGIYSRGKDYNRNAIGYFTPVFSGFGAELQYAANNTIDGGLSDGTVASLRAFYNAGNLNFDAAYMKATSMSATGNGAAGTCLSLVDNAVNCAAANYNGDVTGYVVGGKYKVTPAIQLGMGWAHGENDTTNFVKGSASGTAAKSNANVFMTGIGYQATPSVSLGLNYLVTTADSSMYNFQTRYALSKRTTAYFQANMVKNGSGSNNGSTTPFGNALPLGGQTNTSPSVQVQGMGSKDALPNTTQSAFGVGIIHNF